MQLRHTLPLALLLGACGTAPKPILPDGSQRVPVNTQDRIDAYLAQTKQERLTAQTETIGAQRIAALENQVRDVRQLLASWAKADGAPGISTERPLAPGTAADDWIELRPGLTVFHFVQPTAIAVFQPSAELQARLLAAAAASRRITIRARTGGAVAAPARRHLTESLAAQARDHLVQHGVAADLIGVDLSTIGASAGADATGNRTSRGRRPVASVFLDIEAESSDYLPRQAAGGVQ